jgi:threonine dehydrogenase-like Zn-dependent dehydrogenase
MVGGICGSDLPYFKGRVMPFGGASAAGAPADPPAGAPLHEVVGEVVSSKDDDLRTGSLVVGWASSMNAMAEYIVVNGRDVVAFPTEFSPSVAIMLQPLACVIYAADTLQNVAGSHVAIIGQGPIGILFSHVLKSRGAARVTGIDRVDRSDVADTFGVDEVVWGASDQWAAGLSDADRPDIVIEAVGHQVSTLADAVTALADFGQIYYFGIPDDPVYPFPMMRFLRSCGRFISGYTPLSARRDCLVRAGQHTLEHPEIIEPYISRTFKFAEAQEAFTRAITPSRGQLKVTLEL